MSFPFSLGIGTFFFTILGGELFYFYELHDVHNGSKHFFLYEIFRVLNLYLDP